MHDRDILACGLHWASFLSGVAYTGLQPSTNLNQIFPTKMHRNDVGRPLPHLIHLTPLRAVGNPSKTDMSGDRHSRGSVIGGDNR